MINIIEGYILITYIGVIYFDIIIEVGNLAIDQGVLLIYLK